MVGTEMYVKIQELKRKGYKKQRAARELGIDTNLVYCLSHRDIETSKQVFQLILDCGLLCPPPDA